MPIYEYLCSDCKLKFELMRPMSEAGGTAPCPSCGGTSPRIVSAFAACSKGSEGDFSLGGSSCSSCSSDSCSSCQL